jgi:hypothetical protein
MKDERAECDTNASRPYRQLTANGFRGLCNSVRRYVRKWFGVAGKETRASQCSAIFRSASSIAQAIVIGPKGHALRHRPLPRRRIRN